MGYCGDRDRGDCCRWAMTDVRAWVYRVAAALLVALGALTAAPGARAEVVWFNVCPLVMVVAAVLLLVASAG